MTDLFLKKTSQIGIILIKTIKKNINIDIYIHIYRHNYAFINT